jgi:hypothetical protein
MRILPNPINETICRDGSKMVERRLIVVVFRYFGYVSNAVDAAVLWARTLMTVAIRIVFERHHTLWTYPKQAPSSVLDRRSLDPYASSSSVRGDWGTRDLMSQEVIIAHRAPHTRSAALELMC